MRFGLASWWPLGDDAASPVPLTEKLRQAYEATTFTAQVPGGELRLRVGRHHPALDALLDERRALAWAYVTAHNPGSVETDPATNDHAHRQLVALVTSMGFEYYEGDGLPDDATWTQERSVLVLGVPEGEALELGARFGQLAIIVGARGEPARLVAVPRPTREAEPTS